MLIFSWDSLHKEISSQNLPLISPERKRTHSVWPQLSRLCQRPRGETRTGTRCYVQPEATTLWSTGGKAVLTEQWLQGSQRIVSHGNSPVARRRLLFLSSKLKGSHTQTRRRWEFVFIVAISKFLIRQQRISERHGCSLLQQCCSNLITTVHVVWWSESLTKLNRVVFCTWNLNS